MLANDSWVGLGPIFSLVVGWVGLGQLADGLGWVTQNGPMDNSALYQFNQSINQSINQSTAMRLQPEMNMFIFQRGCTMLQPISMEESVWAWSTGCGVIVYCYFHVFRLTNKGNYSLFAVIFFNSDTSISYVMELD